MDYVIELFRLSLLSATTINSPTYRKGNLTGRIMHLWVTFLRNEVSYLLVSLPDLRKGWVGKKNLSAK